LIVKIYDDEILILLQQLNFRLCEERSDEAIQKKASKTQIFQLFTTGLLRSSTSQ